MRVACFLLALVASARTKQLPQVEDVPSTTIAEADEETTSWPGALAPLDKLTVACERDSMRITVTLAQTGQAYDLNSAFDTFNGIVYPSGLGSNSSCLQEYEGARGDLHYTLPLMGCNTMATDHDDGTVEYYNNIIVQPHPKIVTGQGRGYHVRCRYRRRDLMQFHVFHQKNDRTGKALADDNDLQDLEKEFVMLPSVTMQLFKGDPEEKNEVSEAKVGDTVTLVVSLEKQDNIGMLVRNCFVHDALGWAEHKLIDEDGCPLDSAVMGQFQYSDDEMRAQVSFSAHKFAWSPSVYYTCGVKLCKKFCFRKSCNDKSVRPKRDLDEGSPATVKVFTGLYVNEADSPESDEVTREKKEGEICVSQRDFAIGICVAGVILMICVIVAIAFILARRRNPKTYSRTGSSLYSGPYTNTGYSHTS